MTPKRSKRERFVEALEAAYVLGTLYTGLGVAGLLVSAVVAPGILTTALENISGIFLGIGLISFPYEMFLRRKLSGEIIDAVEDQASPILSAVQLDATLRASGLNGVQQRPMDWDSFYDGTKRIRFVPATPTDQWLESPEWEATIALAKQAPVTVEVYIPKAQGPWISSLSQRLGLTEAETTKRLQDLLLQIRDDWEEANRATPSLVAGCRLKVFHYGGLPTVGLVLCDGRWALTMGSLIGAPSGRPITFDIGEGTDSFFADWFENQLNLNGLGLVEEKAVE
jgi:hypothetical protein